jgi:hypothetical protein
MGRDADALPLFEKGLAHFNSWRENSASADSSFSPAKCLGPGTEIGKLQKYYKKMYAQCRKALESSSASICIFVFAELLC